MMARGTRGSKRKTGKLTRLRKKTRVETLIDAEAQGPSDDEQESEEEQEDDDDDLQEVFVDDETEEAAQNDAATQLLAEFRTHDQVVDDADAILPQPPAPAQAPTGAPPPVPVPRKRGRPRKVDNPDKWEPKEVSVTITGGSNLSLKDIDPGLLDDRETFLTKYCLAGMFSLERGGTVSHLHLQGVLRMRAKTVRGITAAIKRHLGWDDGKQPFGSRVMCRGITGNKLHTWTGLLGYCCKDMHEQHFKTVMHNVTQEEMEDGHVQYVMYGKEHGKNRSALTLLNLWARVSVFYQFHFLRMGETMPHVLLRMVRGGHFYPAGNWVIPYQGRGMVRRLAEACWRMLTQPEHTHMDDIDDVFFEVCRDRYFTRPAGDAATQAAPVSGSSRVPPVPLPLPDAAVERLSRSVAKVFELAALRRAQRHASEAVSVPPVETVAVPRYETLGAPLGGTAQ